MLWFMLLLARLSGSPLLALCVEPLNCYSVSSSISDVDSSFESSVFMSESDVSVVSCTRLKFRTAPVTWPQLFTPPPPPGLGHCAHTLDNGEYHIYYSLLVNIGYIP